MWRVSAITRCTEAVDQQGQVAVREALVQVTRKWRMEWMGQADDRQSDIAERDILSSGSLGLGSRDHRLDQFSRLVANVVQRCILDAYKLVSETDAAPRLFLAVASK